MTTRAFQVGGFLAERPVPGRFTVWCTGRDARSHWEIRPGWQRADQTVALPDCFAAPALHDQHVHVYSRMPMDQFVRHGITVIRDLGSRWPDAHAVSQLRSGRHPTVILGGPVLDRPGPPRLPSAAQWHDASDLTAVIDHAVAGHARWLKLYAGFPRKLMPTAVALAHDRGLSVAVHPAPDSLHDALAAGVDEVEHLDSLIWLVREPPGAARSAHWTYEQWAAGVDRADVDKMVAALGGTAVCPTLVVHRKLLDHAAGHDVGVGVDPDLAAQWRRYPIFGRPWRPEQVLTARRAYEVITATVAALFRQDVRLTVGSDTPNPGILPGTGLWEEIRELSAVGIDSAAALRLAMGDIARWRRAGVDAVIFLRPPAKHGRWWSRCQVRGVLRRGTFLFGDEAS